MSEVMFPEGSQLKVKPTGAGEAIIVTGFDSVGGTIGSEGKLNTDTVLSDLEVQYGKSAVKDGGERELTGRWIKTDPGQVELGVAADDGLPREMTLRVGIDGPVWTFTAVFASFVMGELEADKGLRFKAKLGINNDGGLV